MFDEAMCAFFSSGCSLIVGGLTPEGEPFATRAWGLRFPDGAGSDRVRIVLGAAELDRLAVAAGGGGELAATGANVLSLHSVQLKGEVDSIEAVTEEDLEQHRRFCDLFFADVERIDGTERWLMDRLVPEDLVVVVLRVRRLFDQTPGPRAGRPLAAGPA